ncbi:NAD(P)/FAD-dependent oxidoreductase [Arachidicoccus terrestris]|uniref:NAD(P)/FAD-dependent oxidoreductase n=1 Tax=Arachidicoccus terrestris TaxID=2875539 RepID=UPI001CC6716E|nr:FAD-dependent oxidoreductase [Arachidicoccus terrestris]UAY56606.1 FAD-dependent oxidoreductase [Arachidicoccus terrestris]
MSANKVIIIGGGISGLSSARYLAKAGWQVTVLEKGDFTDGCSYGNAGFVCPSHYVQLATPGIARQGLKWMFKNTSPFYIQPRLDPHLLRWGIHFLKRAKQRYVDINGAPLRDIGLLSQQEYENVWIREINFDYQHNGMLEVFQTPKARKECEYIAKMGQNLGLDIELVDKAGLEMLEPDVRWNALGAVNYKCDGHLNPAKLMQGLYKQLEKEGVQLIAHAEVTGFKKEGKLISEVHVGEQTYPADSVVLAAGSWSEQLARELHINLPVVGGRGYSFLAPITAGDGQHMKRPGLLVEGRAAFTPLGDQVRFGGTLEIRKLDAPLALNRVRGIIHAVHQFFPDYQLDFEEIRPRIWSGFRPVSVDGMPYLGKSPALDNLVIAAGHAQLGISLGAATGLLVSELVRGVDTTINISTFGVNRFNN